MRSRLAAAAALTVSVSTLAAFLAAALVIAPAEARPYDPAPASPRAQASQPPPSNAFPVPLPHRASFTDDWHACRAGCSRRHKGNDIFAAEGTPEVAVESGVIAKVDGTDDGLGGLTIWLLGDSGVAYYYAHNSANLVVEGQRVARGEVIGRVGRTGNARTTPPHIHFQVNVCGELSSDEPCTVDPRPHLLRWQQGLVAGGVDGLGWYRPSDATFRRRNDAGSALPALGAGRRGSADLPLAGDWDGDGRDTLGLYRRSEGLARLLDERGSVVGRDRLGRRGRTGTFPIAGDWDGDGRDTVGLYHRATGAFLLRDDDGGVTRLVVGPAGRPDTLPVAGDWNGDGRDTVGLYHRATGAFLLRNDDGTVTRLAFGPDRRPDTLPVAGDWNGDGRDTVALYRRATGAFLLRDDDGGVTRLVVGPAGRPDTLPVAGDWDGDGHDTVGVYRRASSRFLLDDAGRPPRVVAFGRPGQAGALPVAGDWNGRDLVTLDDLRQIFGPLSDEDEIAAHLPVLNAAMVQAGATTPARKAAFLATARHESGFRADAVEPGRARFRGRGLVQLTGVSNYRRAGHDLELDLVDSPSLAANPLVSAAVAAWYWTVPRDINRAADRLDMAAVNIAVGYRPTEREDAERCRDFAAALSYFSGGRLPEGVNCERTILSQLLGLTPGPGPATGEQPIPTPSTATPSTRPPTGSPTTVRPPTRPPTTRPPTTRPPTTRPPTTRPPTTTPTTPPPPSSTTTTTTTTSTTTTVPPTTAPPPTTTSTSTTTTSTTMTAPPATGTTPSSTSSSSTGTTAPP